jgi:cytochrome c oxidase subunit III
MTTAEHTEEPTQPGILMPHGKVAIWFFLVTEIMFFTALIGTYIVLRNGTPARSVYKWPTPHQVHLIEWVGAFNTFVLICSSLTVVLAHYEAGKRNFKRATLYVGVTLALGAVFLVVKGFEYKAKWDHDILPSHIGELVVPETPENDFEANKKIIRERTYHASSMLYVARVRGQLEEHVATHKKGDQPVDADNLASQPKDVQECYKLLKDMEGDYVAETDEAGKELKDEKGEARKAYKPPLSPAQVGTRVNKILEEAEKDNATVHLTPAIPFGNLWSSCYFAMTGFHALHVLGGLVIFAIILGMGVRNKLGPQHELMLELTGLYWHFVDIVWIFLFPLLYLV